MTLLVPAGIMFGGILVGTIISIVGLVLVGSLLSLVGVLAGAVLFLLSAIKMIGELNTVTRNASFPWWPILVPFYGMYWMWMLVPAEVGRAKQMMGVQTPPRGIVLYVFLFPYALASDINDLVR